MARVGVVIPAYNYGRFVSTAITSVLGQTFADLDLVVVDDGSTDDTRAVVAAIADPRLRYVWQENRGLSAARNTGIRHLDSELVGFLDADDSWLPTKLERQVALFDRSPRVGLVASGYLVWNVETGAESPRRPVPIRGDAFRRLAVENLVSGSATTALVRKSVLDRVGFFDETLRACEDWDMWMRIARIAEYDYVDEPLARVRLHTSNMMRELQRMETSFRQVIGRFYADPTLPADVKRLEPRAWAVAHLSLARLAMRSRSRGPAIRELLRAIRFQPLWPDPYIVLTRVATGRW